MLFFLYLHSGVDNQKYYVLYWRRRLRVMIMDEREAEEVCSELEEEQNEAPKHSHWLLHRKSVRVSLPLTLPAKDYCKEREFWFFVDFPLLLACASSSSYFLLSVLTLSPGIMIVIERYRSYCPDSDHHLHNDWFENQERKIYQINSIFIISNWNLTSRRKNTRGITKRGQQHLQRQIVFFLLRRSISCCYFPSDWFVLLPIRILFTLSFHLFLHTTTTDQVILEPRLQGNNSRYPRDITTIMCVPMFTSELLSNYNAYWGWMEPDTF
jgi:hypothetical protein